MLIRDAIFNDIPALLVLELQSETAAHWQPDEYYAFFDPAMPRRVVLVATTDSVPSSVVGFVVTRTLKDEWEIENLVVAPEQRRCGLGTALLREIFRRASSEQVSTIVLEVRESNVAALRLYEKNGFTNDGRRREYYRDPPEDALLLRATL